MSKELKGIILVEDDANDVFFMQLALSKANLEPPVYIATNGQEAIDYLDGTGKFADRHAYPLPKCIFLDLKLPFVHGFEVLEWIRKQPALAEVNVYILTSSPEERDRRKAAELGAKGYLTKPPNANVLLEVLRLKEVCSLTGAAENWVPQLS